MKKTTHTPHPTAKQRLGATGEQIAARALEQVGYSNILSDIRTPFGQIDLYAEDGDALVFIEVKTRRSATFGTPADAITKQKQQHLRNAAMYYLDQQQLQHRNWRIDVVCITLASGEPSIEIFKSAIGE